MVSRMCCRPSIIHEPVEYFFIMKQLFLQLQNSTRTVHQDQMVGQYPSIGGKYRENKQNYVGRDLSGMFTTRNPTFTLNNHQLESIFTSIKVQRRGHRHIQNVSHLLVYFVSESAKLRPLN